jgi:sugar phosphate isomerase/epimerase
MLSPVSRRQFLGAAAAVSTATLLNVPRRTLAAADSTLKIGLQMYSLRAYPVDVALKHAHDLGFEVIEMYPVQFSPFAPKEPAKKGAGKKAADAKQTEASDESIAEMLKKFAALNLKCLGHGVNRFTADHDANKLIFQFAKKAGIRNLTADPSPDSFDSLDKLVAEYDVRIAIHNHGPSHRYNKVTDVLEAIKGHDPRIGACADLGHYIRSGEDPVEVIRSLKGRLYGVHLKDFAEKQEKTKGVILGKGHLDVPGVMRALKQVDFPADGSLSLEYEENKDDPLADIRECLSIAQAAVQTA